MNKNDCIIRLERKEEHRAVETLIRESFFNVYRPGCLEHYVINQLRNDPAFVHELDFVMEKDGQLIGQNMFMRAVIHADDGREIPIMTMGPICIAPEYKRQGYGKILLDYGFQQAKALAPVPFALREILTFTARAAVWRRQSTASAIMVCQMGRMPRFSCAVS